jgi:hypothetical protein
MMLYNQTRVQATSRNRNYDPFSTRTKKNAMPHPEAFRPILTNG